MIKHPRRLKEVPLLLFLLESLLINKPVINTVFLARTLRARGRRNRNTNPRHLLTQGLDQAGFPRPGWRGDDIKRTAMHEYF